MRSPELLGCERALQHGLQQPNTGSSRETQPDNGIPWVRACRKSYGERSGTELSAKQEITGTVCSLEKHLRDLETDSSFQCHLANCLVCARARVHVPVCVRVPVSRSPVCCCVCRAALAPKLPGFPSSQHPLPSPSRNTGVTTCSSHKHRQHYRRSGDPNSGFPPACVMLYTPPQPPHPCQFQISVHSHVHLVMYPVLPNT